MEELKFISDNSTKTDNEIIELFKMLTGSESAEQPVEVTRQLVEPTPSPDVIADEVMGMWNKLESKSDLLQLINKVSADVFCQSDGTTIRYTRRQFNYNAYSANNPKRYTSFLIPKKKQGEFRTIDAPNSTLKGIQRCLNYVFQQLHTPNDAAMGFVQSRSIVDGARMHLAQNYVYNIDLKDFFPSITAGRLFKRLQSKPFSLSAEMASLVTDLCCYQNAEGKSVLPQGAPTSPTITNFICERLDRKLSKLAAAYSLHYTRYADDITFSGATNVFGENGKFCKSLRNIVENEEHFTINTDKTRLTHGGMRQEVTGLTVNQKTNVSRKYVKQLRTMLHNWEQGGYYYAQNEFVKHYKPTKNVAGEHHIENIISGKLDFLKMVKGEKDATYLKLRNRFDNLSTPDNPKINVSEVLDTWEAKGFDAAVKKYNQMCQAAKTKNLQSSNQAAKGFSTDDSNGEQQGENTITIDGKTYTRGVPANPLYVVTVKGKRYEFLVPIGLLFFKDEIEKNAVGYVIESEQNEYSKKTVDFLVFVDANGKHIGGAYNIDTVRRLDEEIENNSQ